MDANIYHQGKLYLYEDLGHGGQRKTVGIYEYFYNHIKDQPIAFFFYDTELIIYLVNKINQRSNIIQRLKCGLSPEMSTEYFANSMFKNGIEYQVNFRNQKGEKRLECIAIVEMGNCDSNNCRFRTIKK